MPLKLDVRGVAFSPNGNLLASADADGTVRLWNTATGHAIGIPFPADTGSEPGVNGVAFSSDGKLLASADGTVRVWNAATGRLVSSPLPGTLYGVNGVAFSPVGELLATADADGTVRLWNPATGQAIGHPMAADTGTGGAVNGVAFSPNGNLLASADADGTVRLWNTATEQAVGPPAARRSRIRRERGGVQPRRQPAGQRRRRWQRADVADVAFCISLRRPLRRCRVTNQGRLDAIRSG